jgi:hypothetical protein
VIAAVWTRPEAATALVPASRVAGGRPARAGGSGLPEPRVAASLPRAEPEIVAVAVLFGILTLAGGIVPSPLFDLVKTSGRALSNLF